MDIKSSPVHFWVQRNYAFDRKNSIIPFEVERINVGGAMNLNTGVFNAPRSGTYHFSFTFMNYFQNNNNTIFIRKNGVPIGAAHADGSSQIVLPSSLPVTLKLISGDTVDLFQLDGSLMDYTDHYTHFTGWLIEEDLIDAKSISPKQPAISASKFIDPVCQFKGFPKSCRDLRCRGHSSDGFYMIQSVSIEKKIDTVYCEFSNSISSRSEGIYI